ncbi:MAG: RNA polymerase sigma-70 factor [Bacteroidota bacterium]
MNQRKISVNLPTRESLETLFERIYRENFDRAFFIAKYLIKSEALAEDVVSEVFISLWKMGSRIKEIKDIESYLFIAVKNQAIRKLYEEPEKVDNSFENPAHTIDHINPEEILLEKELSDAIEEVVSSLPDQCQLIFRMAKNRQMKYHEIADELGISISTVRTQLSKAFSIVRQFLYERYHGSANMSSGRKILPFASLMIIAQGIDRSEQLLNLY